MSILRKLKRARFLIDDLNVYPYLIKKGRFKKLYNHIWCRGNVRDVGGGFLDNFFKKKPELLKMPNEIEFEITTRCGLRCVMCEHTHWDHTRYAKQDLSYQDIKNIVDEWPELKYVGIQGMGNPFLNKDFRDIIKYLDEKGIFINVVENFCEVEDEDMEVIVNHVNRIDLSLDAATKELYEKIRPGSNFEGVERNLKKCIELKKKNNSAFPSFFIRIVAFKQNYDEIPKIIDFVAGLDLNNGGEVTIEISGLLIFDKIKDLADGTTLAPEEILKICEEKEKKYNGKIRIIYQRSKENPKVETCSKWVQPFVMANGDVVFDCGVMMSDDRTKLHKNTFGNIVDHGIRKIWNNKNYKEMRSNVNRQNGKVPKPCVECRSFDGLERAKKYGVIDFDLNENKKFISERTEEIIDLLNQPAKKRKIMIKELEKYNQEKQLEGVSK